MMKIYLNCRFLTQRITGVQRFAYEICKALDLLVATDYPSIQLIGLLPNRQIQVQYTKLFTHIQLRKCGHLNRHLWEQLELPFFARGHHLINLCNVAPLLHFNQSITLHDVIFMTNLDSQKWWFKAWYQLISRFTSRFAKNIFTVSKFSKSEISNYLSIKNSRITVLGNGASFADYQYQDLVLNKLEVSSKSYFLIIGSNSSRKNILLVTSLFATSPNLSQIKLVVVGGNYTNLTTVSQIMAPNIVYTGYISDGELRSLYHHAISLIFPSLYEGFGIPLVESMAENIPIIGADTPTTREVCADAALYFSPNSSESLYNCIQQTLLNKDNLRYKLVRAGQKKLLQYQWVTLSTTMFKKII